MRLLYTFCIKIYAFFIFVAAKFGNTKAQQWYYGRKSQLSQWKTPDSDKNWIWVHVSSLGEFEQGRPIIEYFSKNKPEYKILLTFFSPSGFEVRSNYDKADKVLYLPNDTLKNATKFIQKYKPKMVFFVKYDFWFNYIKVLHDNNIPLYLVSGIFRAKQHFFKFYGSWFRKNLAYFSHFFVQDQNSANLLSSISLNNSTIVGDTRFDRVVSLASNVKPFDWIEKMTKNHTTYIAGSAWEPDDNYILKLIEKEKNIKFIIAPHNVNDERISALLKRCPKGTVKYSEKEKFDPENTNVLIIDCIGILSSIYRYASFVHIGNGFGSGIHNIAEAAVYNIPVIFGPNYHKFKEAIDLQKSGGAFTFKNEDEYFSICSKLLTNTNYRINAGKIAGEYINRNAGATNKIVNFLFND